MAKFKLSSRAKREVLIVRILHSQMDLIRHF